jgi:hypothetical protein
LIRCGYLATLLAANDDDVLRYFILVVALLLDPAGAVALGSDADTARGQLTTPEAQDGCTTGP